MSTVNGLGIWREHHATLHDQMFDGELTEAQAADLIHRIAEAIIPFVGEKLRGNSWVLIENIASGSWGIGGKAFGLKDVRAIQSQK